MRVANKEELHARLTAFRQTSPHAFARHYAAPEQLDRLAYNTTVIELSQETREAQYESAGVLKSARLSPALPH